jgi:hypothetical protein
MRENCIGIYLRVSENAITRVGHPNDTRSTRSTVQADTELDGCAVHRTQHQFAEVLNRQRKVSNVLGVVGVLLGQSGATNIS